MPSVHETAYPRLKASVTPKDLAEVYTPTEEELTFSLRATRNPTSRLYFLTLLKTFQRLGYFVFLRDVARQIVEHIAECLDVAAAEAEELVAYDESGTRRRHVPMIREHVNVKSFDDEARKLVAATVREAALTKEDSADLINVAVEELVRNRFELPGFTTLLKEARRGRTEVNRRFYRQVAEALGDEGRLLVDQVLTADSATGRSQWNVIKAARGRAQVRRPLYPRERQVRGLPRAARLLGGVRADGRRLRRAGRPSN